MKLTIRKFNLPDQNFPMLGVANSKLRRTRIYTASTFKKDQVRTYEQEIC